MKRLTTNTPKSADELLMNFAYEKDGEIYVRKFDGEHDVNINDIVREVSERADYSAILKDVKDEDVFDILMMDDRYASVMIFIATQAAELRGRLAEFEDAEEKGLLVYLPCKVGDTVYKTCTVNSRIAIGSLWDGRIVKTDCDRCAYRGCGCVDIGLLKHECDTMIDVVHPIIIKSPEQIIQIMPYINEHFFLTPEAAQQAIKERD